MLTNVSQSASIPVLILSAQNLSHVLVALVINIGKDQITPVNQFVMVDVLMETVQHLTFVYVWMDMLRTSQIKLVCQTALMVVRMANV